MTKPNNNQTGPRTHEGKNRSSLNALKHGITAKSAHALAEVEAEVGMEFQPFLNKVRAHYMPSDLMENELVERIARCLWRLARTARMEMRLTGLQPDATRLGASSESLIQYERMVDLQLHRAIRALEARVTARRAEVQAELRRVRGGWKEK